MEFVNDNGAIPASEWLRALIPLLLEGHQLKICPAGGSMKPFLTGGRDEAVLSLLNETHELKKNDIVLYQIENGIYVLHRICRVSDKGIYTLGDSQTYIEGPFQRENFIAVVDYIIRKGKRIDNENRVYIALVSFWRFLRPFRPFIIRTHALLRVWQQRLTNP